MTPEEAEQPEEPEEGMGAAELIQFFEGRGLPDATGAAIVDALIGIGETLEEFLLELSGSAGPSPPRMGPSTGSGGKVVRFPRQPNDQN